MANVKQINQALVLWQAEFKDFVKWKNFLIKRHGPLIFGICIDRLRDPVRYVPVFFIHDLLRDERILSLTYATAPIKNGVKKALKFEENIADAVSSLIENTPILTQETVTLGDFLSHLFLSNLNYRYFGKPYLPTLVCDAIIAGCYVGCGEYFLSTLPAAKAKISAAKNINLNIIGGVDEWAVLVKEKALAANEERVLAAASALGLPELKNYGLLRGEFERDYLSEF